VPSAGKPTGRAAQEVAFSLAHQLGARALIAHVVTTPSPRRRFRLRSLEEDPRQLAAVEAAEQMVAEAKARASELGARAEAEVRTDVSAPDALLSIAREHTVDLVVLAASVRQFSGRPFLGHGVEYLLEKCPSTVVVVTLPPGWSVGPKLATG
jgi:nucleotide-binding universal stress UspA family protein